jgi:hypothetical protein
MEIYTMPMREFYLLEDTKIDIALTPNADMFNTNPATAFTDVSPFHKHAYVIHKASGGTGVATVVAMGNNTADQSTPVAVPFSYKIDDGPLLTATATGITLPTTAKTVVIEPDTFRAGDDANFSYLKFQETVDAPVVGGVVFVGYPKRYT